MEFSNERMVFLWVIGTQFKINFSKNTYTNSLKDISINNKLLKIVKKHSHKIDYHLNPFSG